MYLKQFYLGCLAHASYLLGSQGEAVVIDPQRDVDQYIEEARKEGLSIKYIIETHLHADFVSGHRELAEKSGAEIVFGAKAGATFPHLAVSNGDVLKIGTVVLSILETPGHTPESICILAKDTATEEAAKLFSGDTLFIGDVGRPDLVGSKGNSEKEMASLMYESLHEKLLKLSDDVEVLPAHGAGSLCGKHLSNEKSSTIGLQKQFNYALKPMSKEAFITMLTADLPEVPAYFPKDVEINRHGALPIEELARPKGLKAAEVNKAMQDGTVVLDIRSGVEFAGGHIKGSLNIGLSGQFASWAGTLLELGKPVILVATDAAAIDEAVVRLARIGIETVVGYQENGMLGWSDGGFEVVESLVITVDELKKELDAGEQYQILDVRRTGEYQGGHVPSAINVPLAELPGRLKEVPTGSQIAVICASGYRSSIAKSVLERAGFKPLLNVLGGTAAWKNAGFELEQKETSVV
ncbi:MAG: MBL fold metallo-hydrolase [Candidatus Obscuribacterales bacterium]